MKYLLIFILFFSMVSPVAASEIFGQVTTGISTGGGTGIVMVKPTATPDAGTYTSAQTVTLSAPGSTSIHYFLNTADADSALTCSTGATTNPVTINGSGALRAIACYGSTEGPLASFAYIISTASTPATSAGGGGGSYIQTPTSSYSPADFNHDGKVDLLDLNILTNHWGDTNATRATGDANGDGVVNILDLGILATQWNG